MILDYITPTTRSSIVTPTTYYPGRRKVTQPKKVEPSNPLENKPAKGRLIDITA